jgi:hypothetical protein
MCVCVSVCLSVYSKNSKICFVKVRLVPFVLLLSGTSLCEVDMLDVDIDTISHNYVLRSCIVLMQRGFISH